MRNATGRGFTIIEVVIAYVLLALLLVLAFYVVHSSSRPVADATVRANMNAQGSLLLARLQQELENGHQMAVGTWDGTFGATSFVDALDDDANPAVVRFTGRAVRFRNVDRTTPFASGAPNLTNREVIWAFVPDEAANNADDDGDGLTDELMLVRQERVPDPGFNAIGPAVPMLREVFNETPVVGGVVGPARFQMFSPSNMVIEFELRRQVDFDTATMTRQFASTRFRVAVNVRNMNF